MKRIKQLSAALVVAVLGLTSLAPGSFAASDLIYKTNSANIEMKAARTVWGLGQSYEGHQGTFTLVNKDVTPLKHWTVEFDYEGQIKSVSNAVLVSQVGNHYTVKAPSTWNQTILPGKSLIFQFVGKKTANDPDINNVLLYTADQPIKVTVIKAWALKATYNAGDRVTYNGINYKCRSAHTAHAFNWTPNLAPALWAVDRTPAPKSLDVLFNQ